jgi:hypothetical protein
MLSFPAGGEAVASALAGNASHTGTGSRDSNIGPLIAMRLSVGGQSDAEK